MSRFMRQTHVIWHCLYHVTWVPKYRYRILSGDVASEVSRCIYRFSAEKKCIIEELNIQEDHVHMILRIPPKLSVSEYMGLVKGRTAIRIFKKFTHLKVRPYWGNH